jgi:hypothetical protein
MRLMTAVLTDEHVHEKVFNDRIGYKYGSGVPCLPLKKRLVLDKLIL